MNFVNMQKRVARKLEMLAADGTTFRDGKVTRDDIKDDINDVYREVIFQYLSDKYPEDFTQTTYPLDTYTATGTVSSSSTSSTLVASTSIFNNSMEGFTVQNITDDETRTLETYSSATQYSVDEAIDDDWDGDTIYILGNEYTFGGSATDLKEILSVGIKYNSSDTEFTLCSRIDKKEAMYRPDHYSTGAPKFYVTTVDVGGTPKVAIGIVPYPTDYQGKIQVTYIERPPALSADNDEPSLHAAGISEVLVNGAIARGLRIQGKFDEAREYEEMDPRTKAIQPRGLIGLINSYSPKSRSGPRTLRLGKFISNIGRRRY